MTFIIRTASIAEAMAVEKQIPEFQKSRPRQDYEQKLAHTKHLILVAESDGQLAGFKVGYQTSSAVFHSWLGGVLPRFRHQKIATRLRHQQESWALDNGYHSITVNSYNRFKSMLCMLILNDYQITGLKDGKISFTKQLLPN